MEVVALELNAKQARVFRITHIKNVPWILSDGLHCRSAGRLDPNYVPIGDIELIEKRSSHPVPIPPEGTISDYVAFYFTPRSVMLSIVTGQKSDYAFDKSEIVIMETRLRSLADSGFPVVFTDCHAYSPKAKFFSSMDDLDKIRWDLLQKTAFAGDYKGPYQAEALIHCHLPVGRLASIACYGESEKAELEQKMREAHVELKVDARPDWYF